MTVSRGLGAVRLDKTLWRHNMIHMWKTIKTFIGTVDEKKKTENHFEREYFQEDESELSMWSMWQTIDKVKQLKQLY